jgi:murein DD-endopeptidase MepM/ murein hydrolase activator NlpD
MNGHPQDGKLPFRRKSVFRGLIVLLGATLIIVAGACSRGKEIALIVTQTTSQLEITDIIPASHEAPTISVPDQEPTAAQPDVKLTSAISPSASPQATASPSGSSPTATAMACSSTMCTFPGHFYLQRPIAPTGRDTVDPTYRYGSTQDGERETHHGVELVNSQGTPVLASADGEVIVAGNDQNANYADWPYFYGNLVIIRHHIDHLEEPVFTLYGHLFEVNAQVGQQVEAGDLIGLVGFTGTAVGSHLHFEVRVGENDYDHTRNPELWLTPHNDSNGQPHGAIVGRVLDEIGGPIYIPSIVIERLSSDGEIVLETFYLSTYADKTVHGDDEWDEHYALSNVPAGKYRVSFVARGLQNFLVSVFPGQVTMVTFDARTNQD